MPLFFFSRFGFATRPSHVRSPFCYPCSAPALLLFCSSSRYARAGRAVDKPAAAALPAKKAGAAAAESVDIDEIFTKLCEDVDPETLFAGEGGIEGMVHDMAALDKLLFANAPRGEGQSGSIAQAFSGMGAAHATRGGGDDLAAAMADLDSLGPSEARAEAQSALLSRMQSLVAEDAASSSSSTGSTAPSTASSARGSSDLKRGFLNSTRAHAPRVAATTPAYTVDRTAAALAVTIELPLLKSMTSVALDLSSTRLKLSSTKSSTCPAYKLDVALPALVNSGEARAKFKRKHSRLVVTLPLQG